MDFVGIGPRDQLEIAAILKQKGVVRPILPQGAKRFLDLAGTAIAQLIAGQSRIRFGALQHFGLIRPLPVKDRFIFRRLFAKPVAFHAVAVEAMKEIGHPGILERGGEGPGLADHIVNERSAPARNIKEIGRVAAG